MRTPKQRPLSAGTSPAGSRRGGFLIPSNGDDMADLNAEFPAYKTASVASLIPYARNSRTHSDAQVGKIAASIREFGFLNPIIVDGANGIIAGHGRVMAAQKLGLETLPVIEAGHLTEAQKRAYIIADNRLALDAGWDNDLLKIELQDLQADGFDLSLTGFEVDEIGAFLADDPTEGLTDPDAVPDAPEVPVTAPGDVWLMGAHFECSECKKQFSYAEGLPFAEDGCPCGKA